MKIRGAKRILFINLENIILMKLGRYMNISPMSERYISNISIYVSIVFIQFLRIYIFVYTLLIG